jgi:hypothetical protein
MATAIRNAYYKMERMAVIESLLKLYIPFDQPLLYHTVCTRLSILSHIIIMIHCCCTPIYLPSYSHRIIVIHKLTVAII